jgi:dipeptidyl aminopeptidase/acylaminoacyl peptidase
VVACTPHPGFGTVSLRQGAIVRVVDLATCASRTAAAPKGVVTPTLTTRGHSLVYRGRVVYTARAAPDTVWPVTVSPDRRWVIFALDPFHSVSLATDGLVLQAVSVHGGTPRPLTKTLMYDGYHTWCGGKLVLTAGGDRIAWHNKRLAVTSPPDWRIRPLVRAPGRAWGTSTCAPDGRSIVVQSQPASTAGDFYAGRWALWRVGLDGTTTQLTQPPKGYDDESPRISRDGRTIFFVRQRRGHGQLYALRDGRVVGPLLSTGYRLGYYGANDWWQSMTWSLAPSR